MKSSWLAVGFYAVFLVGIGVIFLTIPHTVIRIFNDHPDVLDLGGSFLRYLALALLFLELGIILGRALSGAGDTLAPMIITFISLIVIGIPLVWFFSRRWGVTGAWIAIAVSEAVQGVLVLFWFRLGKWKTKKI